VQRERAVGERALGRRVRAAHQELVIERDLRGDRARFAPDRALPQAHEPERALLCGEIFGDRLVH
jgi:hypothetical protein